MIGTDPAPWLRPRPFAEASGLAQDSRFEQRQNRVDYGVPPEPFALADF